jgi:hypothetical protein
MKNEVSQLLYNQIRFFIKMSPKSNQQKIKLIFIFTWIR